MVFLAAPVRRTVGRIELPSTRRPMIRRPPLRAQPVHHTGHMVEGSDIFGALTRLDIRAPRATAALRAIALRSSSAATLVKHAGSFARNPVTCTRMRARRDSDPLPPG